MEITYLTICDKIKIFETKILSQKEQYLIEIGVQIINEVLNIIDFNVINEQCLNQNVNRNRRIFSIKINKILDTNSIKNIIDQLQRLIENNVIFSLLQKIINENDLIIVEKMIVIYNKMGLEGIKKFINSENNEISNTIKYIFDEINRGHDLIDILKNLLIISGLDPNKKENIEKVNIPNEITFFINDLISYLTGGITQSTNCFFIKNPQSIN